MIKVEISEELEIFTAVCLLSDNKKIHTFFNEYIFYYISNIKKNLSFLTSSKMIEYLNKYEGCILLDLMEEPCVKKEIENIKQSEEWKKWWNCWIEYINQIISFYTEKIQSIIDLCEIKDNVKFIIPLFYKKTLTKAQACEKILISNFGYTFEENIIMIQKPDSILEDDVSRLLFHMTCKLKQFNKNNISHNLSILSEITNISELKEIDNQLKMKFNKYNFLIDNLNPNDVIPVNNDNILKKEFLINILSEAEILLIGEQHFISEQEKFLINFYEQLYKNGFKTICLEVPEKYQEKLEYFLDGKLEDLDEKICIMRDFIFKIKELRKTNTEIKIFCVDCDTSNLNTHEDFINREHKLAENINLIKQKSTDKVLTVFGNYHVQKSKKFYLFRNDESQTLAQTLSNSFKCISINVFGLVGEQKVSPVNCKIRYRFNNANKFISEKYFQNDENILLKYPIKTKQTVFLDSNNYKTINENEKPPFDYSLIFKEQSVCDWSNLYEKY